MLKFKWKATCSDGTSLDQFNEDGSENLFSAIDQTKLENFLLSDGTNNFTVNLTDGYISIETIELPMYEVSYKGYKYKLIYYRTVEQKSTGESTTVYNLGYHTNVLGENKKFIITILDNGQYFINYAK